MNDRDDTLKAGLTEPWEQIVDAAARPARREKAPAPPPAAPSSMRPRPAAPPPQAPSAATKRASRAVYPAKLPDSSLDIDTDEGVVQVPPEPLPPRAAGRGLPPPSNTASRDLPAFGSDSKSWPSGQTKPIVPPLKRPVEKKRSDLLENKPVTGAKYPARPTNEETRHGRLVNSSSNSQQGETIAAPGQLAGLLDGVPRPTPSRPELVDDLMTNSALRKQAQAREKSAPVDAYQALFGDEREQRRAEMRKTVETTSPDELRNLKRPPPPAPPVLPATEDFDKRKPRSDAPYVDLDPLGREDTRDDPPSKRLEETRALVENPLARPAGIAVSGMLPLVVESPTPHADARALAETDMVLRLASGKRRFLALVIDALIVLAIVAVPALLGLFGDAISSADWFDPDDLSLLLMQGKLTIPLVLIAVLILIFSAAPTAVMGRSVGKLVCGLEVVRKKTGARAGPIRAVVRAFLSLFSVLLGGAGYLWLLVDRRARTLHDYLTGTVVILADSRETTR